MARGDRSAHGDLSCQGRMGEMAVIHLGILVALLLKGLLDDLPSGEGCRRQAEDSRITHSSLHFPSISMATEDGRKWAGLGCCVQACRGTQ